MKRWCITPILFLLFTVPLLGKGTRELEPLPSREPLEANNRFVIAVQRSQDPIFLDPIGATDATSLLVLDGLFEGLFSLDPITAEPILALAQKASVSDDGLVWTFILDKEARFSNGDPIDAEALIESWLWLLDRSKNGEGNTYLVSMMGCIQGVEAYMSGTGSKSSIGITSKNPSHIQISLQTAAPYLPAMLGTTSFAAIHESLRNGGIPSEPIEMIGSGPYQIESITETEILLSKQAWYRDYESVPSDYIQFRFMDQMSILESYLNGEIDWSLAYIPRELLHTPRDLRITSEYSTGFYYFSSDSEPYTDKRVRRALEILIPWDEIRTASGQIFPTSHLIPNHGKPFVAAKHDKDLATTEALNLLAEAGYPYGAGLPTLHMAVHRGSQVVESAERIADIWSKTLGMTVVLDIVPLSMYSRFPALSPYDFAFITWIGDFNDPFTFLHLYSSGSGYNLGKYSDQEYDRLLTTAMSISDNSLREAAVDRAEEYLLSASIVFPIYHGITTNIIDSEYVTGWHDNTLNIHPVKYLGTTRD